MDSAGKEVAKLRFCSCPECKECTFEAETNDKLCLACKSGIHKK